MATSDATRFLEVVRQDRSIVEKVIIPNPSAVNGDDIVKIGADLGYHFNADELNFAVSAYLVQHAAELNSGDLDYLKAASGC